MKHNNAVSNVLRTNNSALVLYTEEKYTFLSAALSRRYQDDILECLRKAQGVRTIPGEQLSSVIAAKSYTHTNVNLIYRSRLAGATLIYGRLPKRYGNGST